LYVVAEGKDDEGELVARQIRKNVQKGGDKEQKKIVDKI
jgi:hypothetical protein